MRFKNILKNFVLLILLGPLVIGGVGLLLGIFILPLIIDHCFLHYQHIYPKTFGAIFLLWVCFIGAIYIEILEELE
jgi:hypothetical protein